MSEEESFFGRLFLKKWHPHPTIPCAQIIFVIVGTICLIFGITITSINQSIVEFRIFSYNMNQGCANSSYNMPCNISVQFPNIPGPVFMFYDLSNFYQNHRKYVKSKNNFQLLNNNVDIGKTCDPATHNSDLFEWQRENYIQKNNSVIHLYTPLLHNGTANPCGLIAKSYFNDTYTMFMNQTQLNISETGLIWPNDANKYKTGPNQSWIDVENEHFIIWMTPSGLPEVKKLWGRIDSGIKQGLYTIVVQNNYNPTTFSGQKDLIFSNSSGFGGRNGFLGTAFLIVGSLLFCVALFFQVYSHYTAKRQGSKSE